MSAKKQRQREFRTIAESSTAPPKMDPNEESASVADAAAERQMPRFAPSINPFLRSLEELGHNLDEQRRLRDSLQRSNEALQKSQDRLEAILAAAFDVISGVSDKNLITGILRDISRQKELEREVVEISALEQ